MLLVTRAAWGARAPKSTSAIGTVRGHALHYEGPKMGEFPHDSCASKVRGIQAFHMGPSRGWADIAYNALVCPHGYVFEGRGPSRRSAAQGTNDGNAHFLATCFLGGVDDVFTDAAKLAFLDAFAWMGGGGERRPHSFFHATGCPGSPIRTWIEQGLPRPGGGPAPGPAPEPPPGQYHHGYGHGEPMVKFAVSPFDGKVHGAVWHPAEGKWFWQRSYSEFYWEVADVQLHMQEQGHRITVDGRGGPNTRDNLLNYQRARGGATAADAVVGPRTWNWLHGR